jgi:large subunit ribosomal protein L29
MKKKELKEMTSEELNVRLAEVRDEQFKLKLAQVSGQLENPSRIRELRREVARVMTLQNQRKD